MGVNKLDVNWIRNTSLLGVGKNDQIMIHTVGCLLTGRGTKFWINTFVITLSFVLVDLYGHSQKQRTLLKASFLIINGKGHLNHTFWKSTLIYRIYELKLSQVFVSSTGKSSGPAYRVETPSGFVPSLSRNTLSPRATDRPAKAPRVSFATFTLVGPTPISAARSVFSPMARSRPRVSNSF